MVLKLKIAVFKIKIADSVAKLAASRASFSLIKMSFISIRFTSSWAKVWYCFDIKSSFRVLIASISALVSGNMVSGNNFRLKSQYEFSASVTFSKDVFMSTNIDSCKVTSSNVSTSTFFNVPKKSSSLDAFFTAVSNCSFLTLTNTCLNCFSALDPISWEGAASISSPLN